MGTRQVDVQELQPQQQLLLLSLSLLLIVQLYTKQQLQV
jgi:hypothetical protein